MSAVMTLPAPPAVAGPAVLTVPEAEVLSGFCDKSLKRWAEEGEKLGRFKQGRAVRYHRQTLLDWLQAKADAGSAG